VRCASELVADGNHERPAGGGDIAFPAMGPREPYDDLASVRDDSADG
jgi:hypothetical protein